MIEMVTIIICELGALELQSTLVILKALTYCTFYIIEYIGHTGRLGVELSDLSTTHWVHYTLRATRYLSIQSEIMWPPLILESRKIAFIIKMTRLSKC